MFESIAPAPGPDVGVSLSNLVKTPKHQVSRAKRTGSSASPLGSDPFGNSIHPNGPTTTSRTSLITASADTIVSARPDRERLRAHTLHGRNSAKCLQPRHAVVILLEHVIGTPARGDHLFSPDTRP